MSDTLRHGGLPVSSVDYALASSRRITATIALLQAAINNPDIELDVDTLSNIFLIIDDAAAQITGVLLEALDGHPALYFDTPDTDIAFDDEVKGDAP